MARDRYPSDEKRLKTPPHVKVPLTISSDEGTAAAWDSLEQRAMLVELWRLAAVAFAGRNGGRFSLNRAGLQSVSGRSQFKVGLKLVRSLCDLLSYSVEVQGEVVSITMPNFAKEQGFHSADCGVAPRTPSASESDSSLPPEEKPNTQSNTPLPPSPQTVASAPADAMNGTHRNDLKAQVRAVWPECQKAAARHGRRWGALNEARVAVMAARLREFGPDPGVLVRAIDGAVAYWRASAPKDSDPSKNLTPETVYRASNFPKYIEAMEDPKVAPKKYWSQMTLEEQTQMRREMGMIS